VVVGHVHQVFEEAKMLVVEEWNQINSFYNEFPLYSRTLDRQNLTMPFTQVFGPLVSQHEPKEPGSSGGDIVRIELEFTNEHQPEKRSFMGDLKLEGAGLGSSMSDFLKEHHS